MQYAYCTILQCAGYFDFWILLAHAVSFTKLRFRSLCGSVCLLIVDKYTDKYYCGVVVLIVAEDML
jgi:hypothetical protein